MVNLHASGGARPETQQTEKFSEGIHRRRHYRAYALMLPFCHAAAAEFKVGSLVIENPWTRATPKGATIGGGYLEIKNNGTAPNRLLHGSVSVAKRLQIHSTTTDDGVAKMREITAGIEIKPGEAIRFEPGGSHLMFVNLMQPLHEGETVRGTLTFEHAGAVDIEYAVVGVGAKGLSSPPAVP